MDIRAKDGASVGGGMPPVPEQNLILVNQIFDSARRVIRMEDKAWPRNIMIAEDLSLPWE